MRRFMSVLSVAIAVFGISATAQESTPTTNVEQTSVIGTAMEVLPDGDPGTVAIIAYSSPNDRTDTIGIVVRNNTDDIVSDIAVKAELRDASGKLVAVADNSEFRTVNLNPGEVSIGLILGANVNDPTLDITFKLTYEEGAESNNFMGDTDLEFVSTEWTGDRILGEFRNPAENSMENIYLSYACFTSDGALLGVEWGSAHGILDPGDSTTFQVGDYDPNMSSCELYLVSGHGYAQGE